MDRPPDQSLIQQHQKSEDSKSKESKSTDTKSNESKDDSKKNTSTTNKPPITQTLRQGSRGSQVKILQERLNSLGYNAGKADGIFGSKTRSAVMAFQKANKLTVDGIVGPATIAKLYPPKSQPKAEDSKPKETKPKEEPKNNDNKKKEDSKKKTAKRQKTAKDRR